MTALRDVRVMANVGHLTSSCVCQGRLGALLLTRTE